MKLAIVVSFVAMAGCGGESPTRVTPPPPPPPIQRIHVSIDGDYFDTDTIAVNADSTIEWQHDPARLSVRNVGGDPDSLYGVGSVVMGHNQPFAITLSAGQVGSGPSAVPTWVGTMADSNGTEYLVQIGLAPQGEIGGGLELEAWIPGGTVNGQQTYTLVVDEHFSVCNASCR